MAAKPCIAASFPAHRCGAAMACAVLAQPEPACVIMQMVAVVDATIVNQVLGSEEVTAD